MLLVLYKSVEQKLKAIFISEILTRIISLEKNIIWNIEYQCIDRYKGLRKARFVKFVTVPFIEQYLYVQFHQY